MLSDNSKTGVSEPQHSSTSSSLRPPRSSELAHSPSLPRLIGTDCRYTFVSSSQLTVLKSRWSLSSSPLTAPNWYVSRHCMISMWQVFSHCIGACPCNDFLVLWRVTNCLCIIVIYAIISTYYNASWYCSTVLSAIYMQTAKSVKKLKFKTPINYVPLKIFNWILACVTDYIIIVYPCATVCYTPLRCLLLMMIDYLS